jgi:hypothetical protein
MRWLPFVLAFVLLGCGPAFEPTSASVAGTVELETPKGLLLIDLKTGFVLGDGASDYQVRSVTVEADVRGHQGDGEDAVPARFNVVERLYKVRDWKPCTEVLVKLSGLTVTKAWGCDEDTVVEQ